MKHLKLSRRELDALKRDTRPDNPLYVLFEHVAALEAENDDFRGDLHQVEAWLQEYGMELDDVKAVME